MIDYILAVNDKLFKIQVKSFDGVSESIRSGASRIYDLTNGKTIKGQPLSEDELKKTKKLSLTSLTSLSNKIITKR